MNSNEVRQIIKDAFMPHLEQIPHSPGLFLDGYFYRPKHQDSLSLAIDDATEALAQASEKACRDAVREKVNEIEKSLTSQHESDED